MRERFESHNMICEVLISDGSWTIGYVDGRAAQWDGNTHTLNDDEYFYWAFPYMTFGVQTEEYRVTEGHRWEEPSETS